MIDNKREHPKVKLRLHLRNKHRERYDFHELIGCCRELAQYVRLNDYQDESIDFFDPGAVRTLNKALLKYYYGIDHWNIPPGYLCPPVPGRADYIHYLADLLGSSNQGSIPTGNRVKCLDVGVGANCIYPIIGNKEYGWSFVGCDIDQVAMQSASLIIESNSGMQEVVELRLQSDLNDIFNGIIQPGELFDLTICNPPFHSSMDDAQSGTLRKLNNLNHNRGSKPILNFGGQSNELWCKGGEVQFVSNMIFQSSRFAANCLWFSTLISRKENLDRIYKILKKVGAFEVKTIPMGHGNKISRIVVWTFLSSEKIQEWVKLRWKE